MCVFYLSLSLSLLYPYPSVSFSCISLLSLTHTHTPSLFFRLLYLSASPSKDTIYSIYFEPLFLSTSQHYYALEGEVLLRECDASTFLKRVNARLIEEKARCCSGVSEDNNDDDDGGGGGMIMETPYLSPATEPRIAEIVEKELIERHISTVIEVRDE